MAISDKLQQLLDIKQDIKTAIETKDIPMTDVPFTEYANKILDIIDISDYNSIIYKYENKNYNRQLYLDGEKTIPPIPPTKDGHTFVGWFAEGEDEAYTFNEVLNDDIVLYAMFEIHKFTVTFKDYDGTILKTQTDVNWNTAATAPNDPTRIGYTFIGWDIDFNNVVSDMTVTALYEITEYTITFHWNNSAVYPYYTDRTEMVTDFLTDFYNFVKPTGVSLTDFIHGVGKTSGFDGLYGVYDTNKTDYFDKLYNPNSKDIDATSDKFINQPEYNKWVPLMDVMEEYTNLGFDNEGVQQTFWGSKFIGARRIKPFIQNTKPANAWNHIPIEDVTTITMSIPNAYQHKNKEYNIKSPTFDLPIPKRYGNVFNGWYENANFTGSKVTTIAKGSTGNKNLYAKWLSAEFINARYDEIGDYKYPEYIRINKTSVGSAWEVIGLKEIGSNTGLYEVFGKGIGYSNDSCDLYIRNHSSMGETDPDTRNRFMLMFNNIKAGDRFRIDGRNNFADGTFHTILYTYGN